MAAGMQSEREPRCRMHEVVAGPLHMVNGQRLPAVLGEPRVPPYHSRCEGCRGYRCDRGGDAQPKRGVRGNSTRGAARQDNAARQRPAGSGIGSQMTLICCSAQELT